MPIIHIEMWEGRTKEVKKQIVEGVTKTLCDATGCPPEKVIIVIDDIKKENWAENGKLAA